ncbi:MAG TPA: DUF3592 domain-containing protein [Candidatus Saccharibacteria bacterium]|nr:DUF3592 domain-containing protein [Candidatus Saccharibacteria bacterium]
MDNQQHQQNDTTNQQLPVYDGNNQVASTINISPRTVRRFGRGVGRVFGIGMILFSLPFLIIGIISVISSLGSIGNATTEGTVTGIERDHMADSDGSSMDTCQVLYEFSLDGKQYSGKSIMSSSTYCGISRGSTVNVSYKADNPASNHYHDSGDLNFIIFGTVFTVIGLVPFVMGVSALVAVRKSSQHEDIDGDGLHGDMNPATDEQMRLIEAGFRQLGQFYTPPSRRPTQSEARETLRQIQTQLNVPR